MYGEFILTYARFIHHTASPVNSMTLIVVFVVSMVSISFIILTSSVDFKKTLLPSKVIMILVWLKQNAVMAIKIIAVFIYVFLMMLYYIIEEKVCQGKINVK